MNNTNSCNEFKINGNSCSDVFGSTDGTDLLMDVLEAERQCKRGNSTICVKTTIDQLKSEEQNFWSCIDQFCGKNSDRLVKIRSSFIDKLDKSFNKFKEKL